MPNVLLINIDEASCGASSKLASRLADGGYYALCAHANLLERLRSVQIIFDGTFISQHQRDITASRSNFGMIERAELAQVHPKRGRNPR